MLASQKTSLLSFTEISLSFWPNSLNMERDLGSLILATDISRQNDYLSRFRMHLDQDDLCLSNASHRLFILQVGCLLLSQQHFRNPGSMARSNCVFIPSLYRWLSSALTSATPAGPGSWANSGVRKCARSSSNKVSFLSCSPDIVCHPPQVFILPYNSPPPSVRCVLN